ncbi:putative AraC family transcriptional regulator [Nocardia brasiliensis NBRC 14402]|uniref:GlxA family transcriptional regulator n=1 Tax=Nocardia brasiliensis TaxID=37326 RepID=UPI00045CE495|nr:GlxA family transcriptional regulator [Nocardia brasiliensis]ASF11576.1 GlxA family transcriptional regulator [Nocardia brasiliensis]GAJ82655.1 putative AraC family transcriptional regulator [Nocardia brasiliensis NBRC 14402]SUB09642.1 transcriptional activator FtrA [Nocardia brasiliensis]
MSPTSATASRRRIGILVFDGVKMLDFVGPAEAFVEANQSVAGYEVVLISADGTDVQTSIGARIEVASAADEAGSFDTVVIPGSELPHARWMTPDVLTATQLLARRTRRLASICSGTFVLANLGLLDGKQATTHWKFTADLARRFPTVTVDPDSIFVRDGNVYSSAGVAAGIDLALALVEEDHGADVARAVAQSLVVYMQRAGGQSQFSASLRGPAPRSPLTRKVVDLICANPAHPHTVQTLAAHAQVSVRHLTRLFRTELESSPAEFVAFIRFGLARDKLHAGYTVTEAAMAAGYGSSEALRRAFVARLGISPRKYQERFRSTGVTAATFAEHTTAAVS